MEKLSQESERRIRSEIYGLWAEDRLMRVRELPWRTVVWIAKLAGVVLAVAVAFVVVTSLLTVTDPPQHSSIPRQLR